MSDFDPFEPINASDFQVEDEGDDQIDPADVGLGDTLDDDLNTADSADQIDDNEVDPIGDSALDSIDLKEPSLKDDPEDVNNRNEDEVVDQQMEINTPKWNVVPQDNSDIVSKHVDGYILRARPLSAKNGDKVKYAAQISRDSKIIDKGVIWIKRDVNPVDYLQNISDRILSKFGFIKL